MNPKYEDAGYPKLSDIHEYPNINTPIERKQDHNYQKKNKIPKNKKKDKNYPNQKAPKKPNTNPIQMVPKNQLFMSQGGHQYMAVLVGPPKYVPVAAPKPKYQYVQPQYQYVQPQYQTPYYPTQPMVAQPYAYPYYGQPVRKPKTYVVLPPGYQRDYHDE